MKSTNGIRNELSVSENPLNERFSLVRGVEILLAKHETELSLCAEAPKILSFEAGSGMLLKKALAPIFCLEADLGMFSHSKLVIKDGVVAEGAENFVFEADLAWFFVKY